MAEAQYGAAAFQATNAIGSGYVQADALNAQADYVKKINELNDKTIDYQVGATEQQAADAAAKGDQAVIARAQKTRLMQGSQRAAMAANGSISQDVLNETANIGAADEAALKVNAYREAFGFKSRANAMRGQKVQNELETRTKANALNYAARSSIITGWIDGINVGANAAGKSGAGGSKPKVDATGGGT